MYRCYNCNPRVSPICQKLRLLLLLSSVLFRVLNCSYKEHSDATTDEDDVITTTGSKVSDIPDDAETIEKVLTHRRGKPGGKCAC